MCSYEHDEWSEKLCDHEDLFLACTRFAKCSHEESVELMRIEYDVTTHLELQLSADDSKLSAEIARCGAVRCNIGFCLSSVKG